MTILHALALMHVNVCQPFHCMVLSGSVQYLELFQYIQPLEVGLPRWSEDPTQLLHPRFQLLANIKTTWQRFVRRFQCPACPFQARTLHGVKHHTKSTHKEEGYRFQEIKQRNHQFMSPGLVSLPRPPTGTSGPAPPKEEPWRKRLVEEKQKRHEADNALQIRVKQLQCARTQIRRLEGELKKRA